ncbi:hypothetical protein K1719_035237 [Acacia pycnantha]|nr:hypothetical protein K1719_035237 [Acacia pycnantha]
MQQGVSEGPEPAAAHERAQSAMEGDAEDEHGGENQNLWELIAGVDTIIVDVHENVKSRRRWKIKCGKALFALRTSISKGFIDHVRDVSSPKQV